MDHGVLGALHQAFVQGEPVKKVIKDNDLYFKIADQYYKADAASNLKIIGNDAFYPVGDIAMYWLLHKEPKYTSLAIEVGVGLIPRPHRKPIVNYIETGESKELVFADISTSFIPASEFEDTDVGAQEDINKSGAKANENGVLFDNNAASVRDLSSDLTAEKIAQLASKAKMFKTQKSKTDRGFLLDAEVSDKNLDHIDKYFKYKTRVHKNSTNCMDTAADFSSVLALVASIKSRENPSSIPKPPSAPNLQSGQQNKANPSQNARGYSRYDQEVFHNDEADEFQIQTGMSFHGTSLKKMNNIKPAAKPMNDSSRESLKRPHPSSLNAAENNKPQKRTSRTPIIIIPASGTALISMFNAMDILQDLKYVSTEEKKRMAQRRENELLIHRRKENGQTVPYRIVDNPTRLNEEEWDRVVAVFAQGPAWQFKGWHWGGNPTTIFSHVCGFHLKFEDAKLDANVAKWSVEILQLSKQKRHLDKAIFIRLWQKIEQFIIRNKPGLRY